MAKVEMSLQEYNEMKQKLDRYKRILNAIITPTVSDWDLKYYKEHPNHRMHLTCDPEEILSSEDYEFLSSMMTKKARDYILNDYEAGAAEIEVDYEYDPSFSIGYLKRLEEGSKEG